MEDKGEPPPNTGVIIRGRKVLVEALFHANRRVVLLSISGYKARAKSRPWERFHPISGYKDESVSAMRG
jgi:hypothetical protein